MAPPQGGLTRRRLIGSAAATGVGVAGVGGATGAAAGSSRTRRRRADVVVVGGGLSGLSAAHDIEAAGGSALVLEARDRVGGRTLNHHLGPAYPGKVIEAGGEWVGPTQDRVHARMADLGLTSYPTYITGNHVYLFEGTRMTYTEDGPTGTAPPDPLIVGEVAAVVALLDQLASSIPVDAPWTVKDAATYDQQTLETWLRANTVTERFRDLARLAVRSILGAEPSEMSLLFALFYIAAAGNEKTPGTFERLFSTRNGSNQDRLHGGSQLIALGLARGLGRRVLLGHPVRRIVQDAGGVTVHADGVTVRAKRAIVAIPPALAGRIAYEPLMPPGRDQLMQRVPQGIQIKCEAIYPKPFWRDAGYSGFALTDAGPGQAVFDNSPPDGAPGVLVSFVCGAEARRWTGRSDADLKAAILQQYGALFGEQARHPTGWFMKAWAREEFSRGCPVGVVPPGVLLDNGPALREPVGRIHWAGTETSTYWNGYMDGAIRAGERAAAEVLAEG